MNFRPPFIPATGPWCHLPPPPPPIIIFAVVGEPPRISEDEEAVRIEFDSVVDATTWALNTGKGDVKANARHADSHVRSNSGRDWTQRLTPKKAKQYLERAPQDILDAVDRIREEIEDVVEPPVKRRRKRARDLEDGSEIDAERVVRREIDGWEDIRSTPREKTTVTIGVNVCTAAFQNPGALIYRGAAAIALADILQAMGRSVEVVGYAAIEGLYTEDKKPTLVRVTLKAPDAPADPGALAFAAAHLGYFRLILLNAIARSAPRAVTGHMGYVAKMPRYEAQLYDVMIDSDITNFTAACDTVRRQFNKETKA